MNTLKSKTSDTTITVDYDQESNTLEITECNKLGGKTVNLTYDQCEHLEILIFEFKNMIHG